MTQILLFYAIMFVSLVSSITHRIAAFSSVATRGLSRVSKPSIASSSSYSRSNSRHASFAASWLTGLLAMTSGASVAFCREEDDAAAAAATAAATAAASIEVPPFDETALTFDHYNGVTLHLDKLPLAGEDLAQFHNSLRKAMIFWKAEGRKGIWIHAPPTKAHLVPVRNGNTKIIGTLGPMEERRLSSSDSLLYLSILFYTILFYSILFDCCSTALIWALPFIL
jgi:hypothetical protein